MSQSRKSNRISWPVRAIVALLLAVTAVVCLVRFVQYRELQKEKAALEAQIAIYENRITELEYILTHRTGEDYISKIAREKMKLYYPDEIIFYTDLNP